MKNVGTVLAIGLVVVVLLSAFEAPKKYDGDTPLIQMLLDLGEKRPDHFVEDRSDEKVRMGYELIHYGKLITKPKRRSRSVSKFYVCTSCHNTAQEDPVITSHDPEARLEHARKEGLPFLQGSTFWGIVNRETWYNGDYVKKYGSLVYAANNSLVESMQLCAVECSQGRKLRTWELESMLAYLWSLELKLADLGLTAQEIHDLAAGSRSSHGKVEWLKSRYPTFSPATFTEPPADRETGYPMSGDVNNGEAIFMLSCQQCHDVGGESDVLLENNKLTSKWLLRNRTAADQRSFYHAIRYGTYPIPGHRPYMPLYPAERLSDQQVEDLRAYLLKLSS